MKKLIFILTISLMSTIWSEAQTIQTIGAPTTTVVSRGNFRTDSIFYLPKRTKAPTDTAAFRYQISDSSLYYWTGYQWTKVQSASSFASVDTNIISTRAWRQKGDDSLLYLITQNIVGGGAAISYYLNHGVVSSVSGYKQMSKSPVTSVGADTSKSGNGLIAQFLTDVSDPSRLEIPAGNWNLEMWFSSSSNGGNEKFYVELLKYNGSTFTSIASSSANPEAITNGTSIDLYLTSLAIPQTTLALTDRLAFRVYIVDNSGARTITLHTQNSHLCQIITNFSSGMTALNGLTQSVQFFATGTSGTDFNISSATDTHTFNLPTASSSNRGALSSSDWTTFNNKVNISDTSTMLSPYLRGSGTSNYFPKFNSTRSVVNSKLYESNLNLLFNTINPTTTTSGVSTIENNGTSAALYVLKTLDTARAYVSFGASNTMDINNLSAGDIRFYTNATLRGRFQTDGTFRLNSLTGTGSRIVVADDNGVLTATSSATGLVDTTVISTRSYRQKGDDSLGAIIATKGSGTVTSVATGYGLSGGTITTTGTLIADTLNLSTRAWRQKGLDSLAALEISGSGTTNYVPKFTNTREIGNSVIFNSGGLVGINTASPVEMLSLSGGTGTNFGVSINPSGWNGAKHRYTVPTSGDESVISHNYNGSSVDFSSYATSAIAIGNGIVRFSTGGINTAPTERARFNAAGRFLINTTSDAGDYKLQVAGASYFNNPSNVAIQIGGGQAIRTTGTLYTDFGSSGSGDYVIRAGSGFTTALGINNTGNVGIGTASPLSKLEVSGEAVVTNGIPTSTANGLHFFFDTNVGYITSEQPGTTYREMRIQGVPLIFRTAGTESGRINSAGELLINTITDAGNYRIQVSGNAYVSGDAILAATSGKVGIGKTNPDYYVEVYKNGLSDLIVNSGADNNSSILSVFNSGSNSLNFSQIRAYGNTTGGTLFSNSTNKMIAFYSNNASVMAIGNINNASIVFGVNDSETIRFHNNGGMRFVPQSATPTANAGTVYYDSDDNKLKVYNGTTWVDLH